MPANKKDFSGVLKFFSFKWCSFESNSLSGRWRHMVHTVVLPCLHLTTKPEGLWRRSGTKSHFDGNIQKLDFTPKVKLTRNRQSRYFSSLVSLLGGGVPPREMFACGWTSHCSTPAQKRNLSKQRHLYLKGSILSLISRRIRPALLSSMPPWIAPLSK